MNFSQKNEAAFQFALQSKMLYVNGQCEECDGKYQLNTDEYKRISIT